jgi:hypothetical protein
LRDLEARLFELLGATVRGEDHDWSELGERGEALMDRPIHDCHPHVTVDVRPSAHADQQSWISAGFGEKAISDQAPHETVVPEGTAASVDRGSEGDDASGCPFCGLTWLPPEPRRQ